MSDPITKTSDPLHAALHEVLSGISSLNMPADPIPEEIAKNDPIAFLTKTDANVKHALEHFRAAFDLINRAMQEREKLRTKIYRLERSSSSNG